MEMAVIAIVALLAGAGLGWFLGSRPVAEWKARHGERDAEARETEEKFRKAIVDLENATVRAGRADALDADVLTGALLHIVAEAQVEGNREAWRSDGAAFFQGRGRKAGRRTSSNGSVPAKGRNAT